MNFPKFDPYYFNSRPVSLKILSVLLRSLHGEHRNFWIRWVTCSLTCTESVHRTISRDITESHDNAALLSSDKLDNTTDTLYIPGMCAQMEPDAKCTKSFPDLNFCQRPNGHKCVGLFLDSILFQSSLYLPSCQYYTTLFFFITAALFLIFLKLDSVSLQTWFCFKVIVTSLVPLFLQINLRFCFYTSTKKKICW